MRNLVTGGLTFFGPERQGRIVRAYLQPQPDLDVPRFAYEDHLAALARDPPEWPDSTRRIAELRVTIEFRSTRPLKRGLSALGLERLNVDIVDYPGEWLVDLPLLGQTYVEWSEKAVAGARLPRRAEAAAELLTFLAEARPEAPQDEQRALHGAAVFTRYLERVRAIDGTTTTEGPGRFLMPGELEGSPLLTFLPLALGGVPIPRGSQAQLLAQRYEAYKTRVVRPFFRDHFARLDRQIVLVDALAAIDRGPAAVAELEATLADVLAAFKPGASPWLAALMPRRIDRILFAATKADHLPGSGHDRLEAILTGLTMRARQRAEHAGAEVKAIALAALRSTREAQVKSRGGEAHDCIVGTPLPGERLGGTVFDGKRTATVFPGDLPGSAEAVLAGEASADRAGDVRVLRFRPVRVPLDSATGERAPWPNVRLDRALDFLIGDRLA